MSKRWVYQGNSLNNHIRPVTPKLIIPKHVGNGLVNLPPIKKGKK